MLLTILAAMSLAGCNEQLFIDPAFVGTWNWTSNVEWTYVFNADGTGQRGDAAHVQSFSWGTRDGVLILNHGQGFVNDELVYTFDGNVLNLTDHNGSFDYFKFVPDLDLVGTWIIFVDEFIEKTKTADGTGFWMPFMGEPNDRVDFNWYVAGNLLIHHMGEGLQTKWTYYVNGSSLLLTNEYGEVQEFIKGNLYQNPALIGTWAWDANYYWEYFFSDNAMGERGIEGYKTQIIWTTLNNILFIINLDTYMIEKWRFAVTDDMLQLFDAVDASVVYSYVRIE